MSTGTRTPLPALPPQTGCLICGDRSHGVDGCQRFLDTNPTPAEWRRAADRHIQRDRKVRNAEMARLIAAHAPVSTGSYDDRMSASIDGDVTAQLRATRFYRGQ